MASIRKEITIESDAEQVWDAVRDVGALHTRLVPGFVTDCQLEPGARVVHFANGLVLRELIVDLDENARRLVWSAVGGPLQHHNGAVEIVAEGPDRCRLVWTTDLLPHEMAGTIAGLMDQALRVMQTTLARKRAA